jgi:hypothetical protein
MHHAEQEETVETTVEEEGVGEARWGETLEAQRSSKGTT